MKVVLIFIVGVFALQSVNAQCVLSTPVVAAPNTVGTTLADTLSLLTVSSLLADKLPFGPNYPYVAPCGPAISPIAPIVSNCGCGGYGYPYPAYIV